MILHIPIAYLVLFNGLYVCLLSFFERTCYTIRFEAHRNQDLVGITARVRALVERSGIRDGLVHIYAQGATAAILIQENWDESVQKDIIAFLANSPKSPSL